MNLDAVVTHGEWERLLCHSAKMIWELFVPVNDINEII